MREEPSLPIREWSEIRLPKSALKLTVYFTSLTASVALILSVDKPWLVAPLQVLLGVIFAHGLELQHECLHHNLLKSSAASRFFGTLLGLPMLVSYTHYRVQHLHHHRFVGTPDDREIFDYTMDQLLRAPGLISRIWNFARIPSFLLTSIGIMQGAYPEAFQRSKEWRNCLRQEYSLLCGVFFGALVITLGWDVAGIIKAWFIPWLLVAEPVHFMIEAPEHLGCERDVRDPFRNTRSYRTSWLWRYITNGNNFHVEHHLWPNVATHHLAAAHERIRKRESHVEDSYWAAIRAVLEAVRKAAGQAQRTDDAIAAE